MIFFFVCWYIMCFSIFYVKHCINIGTGGQKKKYVGTPLAIGSTKEKRSIYHLCNRLLCIPSRKEWIKAKAPLYIIWLQIINSNK